mmetsp:Transcript_22486/g.32832  ORF Transcript_22486/g.32832 Transcript_22486/m.32832 type:complete len:450 (-) Transcript_22486:241-1590(-)
MFRSYRNLTITALAAVTAISSQGFTKKTNSKLRLGAFMSIFIPRMSFMASASPDSTLSYLDASQAKDIDVQLMSSPGFSIDQLMELAGLSVAAATRDFIVKNTGKKKRVLIVCGPGNNGGDGLVAARHLYHFGMEPTILYMKQGKAPIFENLVVQCKDLGIPVINEIPSLSQYDAVVDALFGFSFKGPAKPPYGELITAMASSPVPVLSVDVPSGWSVDEGDIHNTGFTPAAVISLTAPKECMRAYTGVHYLGGRFVPPALVKKYNLHLPEYPGAEQFVRLSEPSVTTDSEWDLYVSPDGYPYYYNPNTQESRWAAFNSPSRVNVPDESSPKVSVLLSTAPSIEEAKVVAKHLLKRKLAACVNIVPRVVSVYEWEGQVEEGDEAMMVIKTSSELVDETTAAIKEVHSYDVPEVISVDVKGGSTDYLKWVIEETVEKRTPPKGNNTSPEN